MDTRNKKSGTPVSSFKVSFHLFLLIPVAVLFMFAGCTDESERSVRIGYVGGLTGRVADLGTAGRDGVILAVEEANAAGGIKGRPVELLVEDDRQDAETARTAVQSLLDKGVVTIIGHMTSAMSVATVPIINEAHVVMISPTTSTVELAGKNDYFYRVYPSGRQAGELLAKHAYSTRHVRRMAIIYDLGNQAYTDTMYESFRDAFHALGGTIVHTDTYTSGPDAVFADMVARLSASEAEGVFFIANAMDTGLFCQRLRHSGSGIPLFTGEWSVTEEILQFGARAVDGIEFFHTVNKQGQQSKFLEFRERFKARFGYEPGFASVHGYDSAHIALSALARSEHPGKLKETLSLSGSFEGLQGPIEFNAFGDVIRNHFLMTIRDGSFTAVNDPDP